jgi:hypothetical protein
MGRFVAMDTDGVQFVEYDLWRDLFEGIVIEQVDEIWLNGCGDAELPVYAPYHAFREHAQFDQRTLRIIVRISLSKSS